MNWSGGRRTTVLVICGALGIVVILAGAVSLNHHSHPTPLAPPAPLHEQQVGDHSTCILQGDTVRACYSRASRSLVRTPAPAPAPASPPATAVAPARGIWDAIADCESSPAGWDAHSRPIPGSANWSDVEGPYRGGLHFTASTWRENGGLAYAATADRATRAQQIAVAESVLRTQGWRAWPVCSRKVGAR